MALVIFDWSGVISDDSLHVYESNMRLLDKYGKPRIAIEEWLSSSAANTAEFLKNYGINVASDYARMMYAKIYHDVLASGMKPKVFQGAPEALRRISSKGYKIAVVSSHILAELLKEASEYGVNQYIDKFVESENKSENILKLCRIFNNRPYKTPFVGDQTQDIRAAKRAGVISIAKTGGRHQKQDLMAENPDYLVKNFEELEQILAKLS